MLYRFIQAAVVCLLISGCAGTATSTEQDQPRQESVSLLYPEPDPVIKSMLDTYRDSLNIVAGTRIATVKDTLRFGKPESPLGNLVADALRYGAGSELGRFVNIGIIGEISFRLFLTPGELTTGEVLEFMPYENHLVVLSLTGEKVAELANQIAEKGGAPVSGMRFRIDGNRARGVLVNSQVLDPGRTYLVATSSWVANGGDQFPALWDYSNRIDLDVDVRNLYLEYFKNRREIYPMLDGRVR